MSSSTVLLCHNLIFLNHTTSHAPSSSSSYSSSSFALHLKPKRFNGVVSRAAENNNNNNSDNSSSSGRHWRKKKKSWWQRFFFEDDGNWLGLKDDDMVESEEQVLKDEDLSEEEKFEAWKQRAEAIIDLREAQEDSRNQEYRNWEDWLFDSNQSSSSSSSWSDGFGSEDKKKKKKYNEEEEDYGVVKGEEEKGLVESVRAMIFGAVGRDDEDEEDLLYEDRVFKYASTNSAKFLAVLIVIPWAMDFLVHDYVIMPFLDRYVQKVPLAAQMLDVRRYQKLEMIKELKTERGRFEFEMEIGKSPPLSEDDIWWELRHKALELRDEWRLENRRAFANIWYHSESGWQTLIEVIVEHYGLEVDQAAVTIFVCLVPVVIDACVKLWLFKFLPRLSPKVSNIFQEMKRH